jgi:hypothetical protein
MDGVGCWWASNESWTDSLGYRGASISLYCSSCVRGHMRMNDRVGNCLSLACQPPAARNLWAPACLPPANAYPAGAVFPQALQRIAQELWEEGLEPDYDALLQEALARVSGRARGLCMAHATCRLPANLHD